MVVLSLPVLPFSRRVQLEGLGAANWLFFRGGSRPSRQSRSQLGSLELAMEKVWSRGGPALGETGNRDLGAAAQAQGEQISQVVEGRGTTFENPGKTCLGCAEFPGDLQAGLNGESLRG